MWSSLVSVTSFSKRDQYFENATVIETPCFVFIRLRFPAGHTPSAGVTKTLPGFDEIGRNESHGLGGKQSRCCFPTAWRKLVPLSVTVFREGTTLGAAAPPSAIALCLFGFRPRACLQIAEQPVKGCSIGVVVLPLAEVGNEILADFTGGIFAGVGVEALPVAQ